MQGLGFRVQGLGFTVLRFTVQGSGSRFRASSSAEVFASSVIAPTPCVQGC